MGEFAPNRIDAAGLWLTITELAEAKGIGKPAISERVARYEAQGLLTTRPGKGKTKLVNLAEYDKLTGQVADLAREQGAATRRAAEEEPESNAAAYTRENARRVAYQADLAHLELQERLGQLVRVDSLRPAIQRAAASTAKILDGLVQEADTLRAVCARDDGRELERTLKTIAHRMRSDIAAALAAVRPGVAAPEDGGPAG